MRLAALFFLLLAGCAQPVPERALTVDEVLENISELDGQEVWVVGWLGECGGNTCGLYQAYGEIAEVENGDRVSEAWMDAMERRLAVGAKGDFDTMAFWKQYQKVAIRGQINSNCRELPYGCIDRADDIVPSDIVRVF